MTNITVIKCHTNIYKIMILELIQKVISVKSY